MEPTAISAVYFTIPLPPIWLRISQQTSNLLVIEERYWALFYMALHKILHILLKVLVQITNKMGIRKTMCISLSFLCNGSVRNLQSQQLYIKQ
jgi:hypothetical protein